MLPAEQVYKAIGNQDPKTQTELDRDVKINLDSFCSSEEGNPTSMCSKSRCSNPMAAQGAVDLLGG